MAGSGSRASDGTAWHGMVRHGEVRGAVFGLDGECLSLVCARAEHASKRMGRCAWRASDAAARSLACSSPSASCTGRNPTFILPRFCGPVDRKCVERRLHQSQRRLNQGKSRLSQGKSRLNQGKSRLNQGNSWLNQGKSRLSQGKSRLNRACPYMRAGRSDPVQRLRAAVADAVSCAGAQVRQVRRV